MLSVGGLFERKCRYHRDNYLLSLSRKTWNVLDRSVHKNVQVSFEKQKHWSEVNVTAGGRQSRSEREVSREVRGKAPKLGRPGVPAEDGSETPEQVRWLERWYEDERRNPLEDFARQDGPHTQQSIDRPHERCSSRTNSPTGAKRVNDDDDDHHHVSVFLQQCQCFF